MDDRNLNVDRRGKGRVQTHNVEPSRTIQSEAHLTDIREILTKFALGGDAALDEAALVYADVSEFTDLHDAMNQAKLAEVEFLKLPPQVRSIFENDVAVWLDTAHDEDKRDALVEAGFIKDSVAPDPAVGTAGVAESGSTNDTTGGVGGGDPAPE